MIRDPSDGSVRETHIAEKSGNKENSLASSMPDTGIRQPTRSDAQERMERSRQWIKDYQERKAAHARGSTSEQEFSQARDQVEGQRKAESSPPARSPID